MIDAVRILRETSVARVEHRPTLASTNDRAAQCAAQGVKDLPLLVVADQQTAGRGRGSNRWWTGPGGLAFSLLVDAETVAADAERTRWCRWPRPWQSSMRLPPCCLIAKLASIGPTT